jgi:hypothetical protein
VSLRGSPEGSTKQSPSGMSIMLLLCKLSGMASAAFDVSRNDTMLPPRTFSLFFVLLSYS